MKSLGRVGLVFSLLIVGVLGGVMAPLPSEAVVGYVTRPTVAAQVDPCGGGASVSISGITKATAGVVTTNGAHGFTTSDKIFIDCVAGMTQVNGKVFSLSAASGSTFTLAANTSANVAYVSGGIASKAISIRDISAITKETDGLVTTTQAHGFVTGDKVYIEGVAGMTQVNGLFFTITVPTGSTNTFLLSVNTSGTGYTPYSSVGKVHKYVSPPIDIPLTACTDAQITALAPGFQSCWLVPTNQVFSSKGATPRYFKIVDVNWPACSPIPCGSPLLKVGDTSTGLDSFVFTNYQFAPTTSGGTVLTSPYWGTSLNTKPNIGTPGTTPPFYGEAHSMRLTFNHTFDFAGNNKSVCTNYSDLATCSALYQISLGISGTFAGGGGGTASGDYVRLSGTGNFGPTAGWRNLVLPIPSGGSCVDPNSRNSPLDVNYCTLQRELGLAATTPSSFSDLPSLLQDDLTTNRYPRYICDRAPTGTETTGNSCKPQMTFSLTATVKGPDSFILPGSMVAAGGGCTTTNNKGGTQTPQGPPCHSNSKKSNLTDESDTFFDAEKNMNQQYFLAVSAEPTAACVGDQCGCSNPEQCSGTILITANVTPAVSRMFPFFAQGLDEDNFFINTAGMSATDDPPCLAVPTGFGCKAFTNVQSLYGDIATFEPDYLSSAWPTVTGTSQKYDVDSPKCTSLLNRPSDIPPYIVSEWTIPGGSVKKAVTVTRLGDGDVVTCNFHAHKAN